MRTGCAPAAATVPIYCRSYMATWLKILGWLGKAPAQVTRLVTSRGEAIAGAISFMASHGEALVQSIFQRIFDAMRHWLKAYFRNGDDVVVAEMDIENLGTEEVPINLPKICTKHDLVVFDSIGQ